MGYGECCPPKDSGRMGRTTLLARMAGWQDGTMRATGQGAGAVRKGRLQVHEYGPGSLAPGSRKGGDIMARLSTEPLFGRCARKGCKSLVKHSPNKEYEPGKYYHDGTVTSRTGVTLDCVPKSVTDEQRAKVQARKPLPTGWKQVRHGSTESEHEAFQDELREARAAARAKARKADRKEQAS